MKEKIATMLVLLLVAMPSVLAYSESAISQVSSSSADVYVVASSVDPSPLVPGGYANVWLKVENRGDTEAPDVSISIPDKFPFRLADGEDRTKIVGKLVPRDSAIVYFKLLLDSGAPSGPTPLTVEIQKNADARREIRQIIVDVERIDAVLSIANVETTPSAVAPGETVKIDVTLSNKADTVLRAIRANLRLLVQVSTTAGLSTVELPFTPIGGGIEKTIDVLNPGKSETLSFNLVADPDAESRPYKIPLEVSYYDPNGNNRTRNEVVGVIVGSEPELSIYLDETAITSKTESGNLLVRFVNRGTGDIKFLTARLEKTDEFVVVNSAEQYIGKIDSDDFEIAEYQISLTRKADSEVELPIVAFYKDSNNNEYSTGVSLTLVRHTPEQLGAKRNNAVLIAIAVIAFSLAAFYWFRRRKNKRK